MGCGRRKAGGERETGEVGPLPSNWNIVQIGDYNGDGYSDLLTQAAYGVSIWLMNGTTVQASLSPISA
jgi:hypothetical protein